MRRLLGYLLCLYIDIIILKSAVLRSQISFYGDPSSDFAVVYTAIASTLLKPASVAQLNARVTVDQELVGSTPAKVGNIISWRLMMKYFLWSFSPFR